MLISFWPIRQLIKHHVYYALYSDQSKVTFWPSILHPHWKNIFHCQKHIFKKLSSTIFTQSCGWTADVCQTVIGSWLSHDPVSNKLGRQHLWAVLMKIPRAGCFLSSLSSWRKFIIRLSMVMIVIMVSLKSLSLNADKSQEENGYCMFGNTEVCRPVIGPWLSHDPTPTHPKQWVSSFISCHHCFGLFDKCRDDHTLKGYP